MGGSRRAQVDFTGSMCVVSGEFSRRVTSRWLWFCAVPCGSSQCCCLSHHCQGLQHLTQQALPSPGLGSTAGENFKGVIAGVRAPLGGTRDPARDELNEEAGVVVKVENHCR